MKPRIFLTRLMPEAVMSDLNGCFEVVSPDRDEQLTSAGIAAGAAGCRGLISMLSDTIDESVLSVAGLEIVANYAAGTNNIDLGAASDRGIAVTNTPGVLAEATADLAFALLLAVARRIAEGDRFVRAGRWRGWAPILMLGSEVQARRLGIIGMGRIGQAVARRAQGFGMDIVYHNRNRVSGKVERALDAHYLPLDELLATSDYVSLHCPFTPETEHLLDKNAFDTIKHGAYLINTARGEVVDEDAMLDALDDGRLTGAGLDVYTGEPAVNPRLLAMENVVLSPHSGSGTFATRTHMGEMVIANLSAFFAGETPPNRVV